MREEPTLVVKVPHYDSELLKRAASMKKVAQGQLFAELFSRIAADPENEVPELIRRKMKATRHPIKGPAKAISLYVGANTRLKFMEVSDRSGVTRNELASMIIEGYVLENTNQTLPTHH